MSEAGRPRQIDTLAAPAQTHGTKISLAAETESPGVGPPEPRLLRPRRERPRRRAADERDELAPLHF